MQPKWTPMEDNPPYAIELTKEEVELIHSLLEQQVNAGSKDDVLIELAETFEVLASEQE